MIIKYIFVNDMYLTNYHIKIGFNFKSLIFNYLLIVLELRVQHVLFWNQINGVNDIKVGGISNFYRLI